MESFGHSAGTDFILKAVGAELLPELVALYGKCEDFLALGPASEASEQLVLADLAQSHSDSGCFTGIFVREKLVGVVDYQRSGHEGEPGTGYISLIMIAKDMRGSGLGRSVVHEIENRILSTPGVTRIKTSVQTDNPGAIRFWQGLGYTIVGGPCTMPDTTTVFSMMKGLPAHESGNCRSDIHIPYGQGQVRVPLLGLNVRAVLEPKAAEQKAETPIDMVRLALALPIGAKPLAEMARGKRAVVIVTSDHTRPMPSHITMPLLLEEIRRGQADANITILVATGLHRATTEAELRARFGDRLVDGEQIVVHSAVESPCVDMGVLPSGNRYAVNSLVVEADLLVCEGYIEPHFFAGFSGGRKSILPGVCSAATIRANHSFRTIANPNATTGVLTDNPIHVDAMHAARVVGVDFILNVALDRHKRVTGAFAGDLEEAHRAGCALVADLFSIPHIQGDIVVTGNGGYPLDQNLYQCAKAISIAAQCAKPGGVLILAAACVDGIGSSEFSELMLAGNPTETLNTMKALTDEETIIDQWCAQVLLEVMLQHEIVVVSEHLDPAVVSAMCMTPAANIAEALAIGRARKGENAEIVIIPDGVSVMVETARIEGQ